MRRIYTKNLYRLIQVNWPAWKKEAMAEKYVPESDIWIVGLDANCELCAYHNHIVNESAAYIEITLNEKFVGDGAENGVLLRSHAVYNQYGTKAPVPGLLKGKIPFISFRPFFNSGILVEGFRAIMFPANSGVFLEKDKPLYMHIQTKGYLTAGLHCNIIYYPAEEDTKC